MDIDWAWPINFTGWVSFIADAVQVVGLPLAVVAIFLAVKQVKSTAIVTAAQMVFTIDEAFRVDSEMRQKLTSAAWVPADASERNRLGRYLAVFERVGVLYGRKLIPLTDIENFYFSQFKQLVANTNARDRLVANRTTYKGVFVLWRALLTTTDGSTLEAIP
jgi:hypothetical protein